MPKNRGLSKKQIMLRLFEITIRFIYDYFDLGNNGMVRNLSRNITVQFETNPGLKINTRNIGYMIV